MQSDRRAGALPGSQSRLPGADVSRGQAAWGLLGILVVGVALRLVSLNTRSFWLDETTSVRQASWSIPDLITRMSDNVHPPLFHIMLHYWMKAFGRSEISVRSFVVIFGIAAIPLVYWAARAIYNRKVGLISAGVVAISPFFVWYSQEARMYTLMLVFGTLSVGCMYKALQRGPRRWWWWVAYGVATGLGTMTQYFYFFLVAGQAMYIVFYLMPVREHELGVEGQRHFTLRHPGRLFVDAPEVSGWLVAMAIAILPSLWWIPKVLAHKDLFSGVSQPFNYGWSAPTFGVHFNELILVPVEWAFGFHSALVMRDLVAMWPLLITLAFLGVGYSRRISATTWYLVMSGVGGAALIAALGTWQPILEARYFTAVTVPLVILSARFAASLRPSAFRIALALVVAISLATWVDQSYNPNSIVKWDNRQAMAIVANGFQPGDAILLLPSFASSIPEYYLPYADYQALRKVPQYDRNGLPRNSKAQLAEDLDRQVGPAERVWVVATWQDTPLIAADRVHTDEWLVSQGYKLVSDTQLHQIQVALYERPAKRSFFIPLPHGVVQ